MVLGAAEEVGDPPRPAVAGAPHVGEHRILPAAWRRSACSGVTGSSGSLVHQEPSGSRPSRCRRRVGRQADSSARGSRCGNRRGPRRRGRCRSARRGVFRARPIRRNLMGIDAHPATEASAGLPAWHGWVWRRRHRQSRPGPAGTTVRTVRWLALYVAGGWPRGRSPSRCWPGAGRGHDAALLLYGPLSTVAARRLAGGCGARRSCGRSTSSPRSG